MKLKQGIKRFLIITAKIGTTMAILYSFKHIGLKGLAGFIIGMLVMAVIITKYNPALLTIMEYAKGGNNSVKIKIK